MKRRKFDANLKKLENNPLDLFPTKGDVIRRTFLYSKSATDISKKLNSGSVEEEPQWLSPSKMDPSVISLIFFFCSTLQYLFPSASFLKRSLESVK